MIRQAIQKIMCCCGNGVGTSLIMQMTIEEALEYLGMDDIEVSFGSLSDISADRADLFIYCISGAAGKSGGFAGRWSGGPYGFRDGSGTIKTIIGD